MLESSAALSSMGAAAYRFLHDYLWSTNLTISKDSEQQKGERGRRGGGLNEERINEKWFCLPIMPSVSHGKEQTERKKEKRKNDT